MVSSAYIVSALKYRPTTFSEVLAQDHLTRTLKHSLKRGHIANAYIFSGPRGTGKTTTARILAKALNCENLQDSEPCNQCESCRMTTAGIHPDVLEIDAASNTGVENIRDLRENVRFTPSIGKYKVYIIDEAHMLSKQANNALLKTLEEPPSHCCFILATTEPEKLLPTILSRCQRYQVRRIPIPIIVEHLRKIVEQEKDFEVDPAELDQILYIIARMSEGCLRDALFTLDQLLAFRSAKIDLAEVESILGAIQFDSIDRYIRAIFEHDLQTILDIIESISNQGKEFGLFLTECMQHLRNLAVVKIEPKQVKYLDLPDEYAKQLLETAAQTTLEQILYVTDRFWETEQRIRHSSMARIILEMTSIKAAKAAQAVKIEDLIDKLSDGTLSSHAAPAQPVVSKPSDDQSLFTNHTASTPTAGSSSKSDAEKTSEKAASTPSQSIVQTAATHKAVLEATEPKPATSASQTSGSLSTLWYHFMKDLENQNPLISAALHNSIAIEIKNGVLRVAIPSSQSSALRTLERPQNRDNLQKLLHEQFGQKLTLQIEPSDDLQGDDETPQEAPEAKPPERSKHEILEKLQENKFFIKLQEELPGSIVQIKPLQ